MAYSKKTASKKQGAKKAVSNNKKYSTVKGGKCKTRK